MAEEATKTYQVTKGNVVTGDDGVRVVWSDDGDNSVNLTAEQAKALKEAGVIK